MPSLANASLVMNFISATVMIPMLTLLSKCNICLMSKVGLVEGALVDLVDLTHEHQLRVNVSDPIYEALTRTQP